MSKLRACAVPQGFMAFTNSVYVANASSKYVLLTAGAKQYVGLCKSEPSIQAGYVAMSALQRKSLEIVDGAEVVMQSVLESSYKPVAQVVFDIEYLGKQRNELSESELGKFMQEQEYVLYNVGSCLAVNVNGIPLKLTVAEIKVLSSDGAEKADFGRVDDTSQLKFTYSAQSNRLFTFKASKERPQIIDTNWKFEDMGIGGLDKEFTTIFRRAFASRLLPPEFVGKLGIKHVKGMLLYGPPGTGKTLIARQIGKMLGGNEPKLVNGPEILNKFVGQAEENIRNLFQDAINDYNENKESAGLHVIIFDEIDAICKARGSVRGGTGVHDTVVNQLLTMIDGVNTPNNILVIGMTNRKDMLDPALLRPGRLEVHVEISLPDMAGRVQILNIHTKSMKNNNFLADNVDLEEIAKQAKNFSGSEIEGLVKSATSYAIASAVDMKEVKVKDGYKSMKVSQEFFQRALDEITPVFGVDEEEIQSLVQGELIQYSPMFTDLQSKVKTLITSFRDDESRHTATVLLEGPPGTGKTSIAAHLALQSQFPFIKLIAPHNYIGLSESAKASEIASAFDLAYKSTLSVLLIDNIEVLLEYVPIGPRFSNVMLQTFLTLLNRPHPKADRKLLVIATTSQFSVLKQMQMRTSFQFVVEVPRLCLPADIKTVLLRVGYKETPEMDTVIENDMPVTVGIKPLLLVAKMAQTPTMTVDRHLFREWLINCGVGIRNDRASEEFEYNL